MPETHSGGVELDQAQQSSEGSHWFGTAKRDLSGKTRRFAVLLAVSIGGFHVYTAWAGIPTAFVNRPIHLTFMAVLVFMWYSPGLSTERETVPWYDWLLIAVTTVSVMYFAYAMSYGGLASRIGQATTLDLVMGVVAVLIVIEMARRMTGVLLPAIAVISIAYSVYGPYMPGIIAHRGYSIERIVSHLYLSTNGIFGVPLGVSATFVVLFIIFGALLEVTGIGDWFINLGYGLTGRLTGGPAKTAVVASGIMGSLNGSAVANTATTGAFTIPLMKRTGFGGSYAGAVECAASCGGQVLPPVMAAAAFIMVSWTGIPYVTIIAAAAIPALLYFSAVGFAVHFRAKKELLEGRPANELPDARAIFLRHPEYVLPLIAIVGFLATGFTPIFAAFYGILITALIAVTREDLSILTRGVLNGDIAAVRDIVERAAHAGVRTLDQGVQMTLVVAAATAAAGIIIGVMSVTGLGLRFTSIVTSLSGGYLIIALLLTVVTSIILGMGLPTTAAYIVLASLGAPALVNFGVDLLAAHLFILYFGVISGLTPPIMLAVFAASAISEADPWETATEALKIAAIGFIIPFLFVYGPELLLKGTVVEIVISSVTAFVGVVFLASGTQGYLLRDLGVPSRAVIIVGAMALLAPDIVTDGGGAVIVGAVLVHQYATVSDSFALTQAAD